jgi:hypothetical protein
MGFLPHGLIRENPHSDGSNPMAQSTFPSIVQSNVPTTGLGNWIGQLDWTTGLDNWIGQLDWTTGLDNWIGINYSFFCSTAPDSPTCSTACREDPLGLPSAGWVQSNGPIHVPIYCPIQRPYNWIG